MEYLPLVLFAIAASITPGPNNTLILVSGVNHGVRKSIPHFLGIGTGFPIMVIVVGLGVGSLFQQFPFLQSILQVVGGCYLLYLAYKIASASSSLESESKRPFTFIQAALFQWINPKAWIMAIGAVVTFAAASDHYFLQILTIALVFVLFGLPCVGLWLLFGASLKKLLSNATYLRVFNMAMASLLVMSVIPTFYELYVHYRV